MATKAELQQEADELGIGEQTKGLNKAEMEEIIENFKNLEVDSADERQELQQESQQESEEVEEVEPLTDDLGSETLDEYLEGVFPPLEVNLEKLATQETINLIVQYRNSRGQRGGEELVKVVRDCIE